MDELSNKIKNRSYLVTGAAGFIGSHIVDYLIDNGAKFVRVIDNLSNGKLENIAHLRDRQEFEFIESDITNYDACVEACKDIDVVCHQAAVGSVPRSIKNPINTNNSNVNGFLNMIFAAKEAGIKRFVYASSSSVYGDDKNLPKCEEIVGQPLSPYAVSKKTNELYAKVFYDIYGMEVIGLRYFNIFGPRQDPFGQYAAVIPIFIKALMENTPIYIDGDGEQTRDFTFVMNAVQANIRAIVTTNPAAFGKVYNVAVGQNYSVNQLYNHLRDHINAAHKPTYRETRMGDIRNSLANISLGRENLGYKPTHTFQEGLELTIDFFKAYYSK